MASLLIREVDCFKKTCGTCRHRKQHSSTQPRFYMCRIFEKALDIKSENSKGGLVFHRLKECIQAEKDYFELLLEGW